jgi:hypothetical protein
MGKRGQCRCGTILRFELTARGYKMRCPVCQSVVRLRADPPSKPRRPRRSSATIPAAVPAAPPPLPTDCEADELPDLSALDHYETDAPPAMAEMEAYQGDPPRRRAKGGLNPWALAVILAMVLAAGGVIAVLLGGGVPR